MKPWTLNPEALDWPLIKKVIFTALLFTALCTLIGCGSTKMVTQTVTNIRHDTIYVSNNQFDSVYVYENKLIDRSRDTIYVRDKSIEYRYRLLRDTIREVHRDSIPYEVTITEVKEITRPLTFFDKLCRVCFFIIAGFLALRFRKRIKNP